MLTEMYKGVWWGLSVDADVSVIRIHFVSASSCSESASVLFSGKHVSSVGWSGGRTDGWAAGGHDHSGGLRGAVEGEGGGLSGLE